LVWLKRVQVQNSRQASVCLKLASSSYTSPSAPMREVPIAQADGQDCMSSCHVLMGLVMWGTEELTVEKEPVHVAQGSTAWKSSRKGTIPRRCERGSSIVNDARIVGLYLRATKSSCSVASGSKRISSARCHADTESPGVNPGIAKQSK
jgi:hypothetical protein